MVQEEIEKKYFHISLTICLVFSVMQVTENNKYMYSLVLYDHDINNNGSICINAAKSRK